MEPKGAGYRKGFDKKSRFAGLLPKGAKEHGCRRRRRRRRRRHFLRSARRAPAPSFKVLVVAGTVITVTEVRANAGGLNALFWREHPTEGSKSFYCTEAGAEPAACSPRRRRAADAARCGMLSVAATLLACR